MQSVMTNIMMNLSSGQLWSVILVIIPFICSLTGICIGAYLIWRLLNWKLDTRFHKKAAKRSYRSF